MLLIPVKQIYILFNRCGGFFGGKMEAREQETNKKIDIKEHNKKNKTNNKRTKTKAWKYHKKILKELDKNLPSETELISLIKDIKRARDRWFIAMLYYTGGRVSEVINFYKISKSVRASRMLNKMVTVIEIYMPNEKTRGKQETKIVPINVELEDKEFVLRMYEYVRRIQTTRRRWGFRSKVQAWKILKRTTERWFNIPFNPHILRHIRTSHLTMRGYHPEIIRRLLGWQSLAMYDRRYSHLNISDLI